MPFSTAVTEDRATRPALHRLVRCTAALVASCALHACVLALGGQHHVSGAELPSWLEPLEVGSTEAQLVAILGPPSARQRASDNTVDLQWTEVIRPRGCRTYLLGIIPLSRDLRLTRRVDARLEGGQLVSASLSQLDRRGSPTSTEPLLKNYSGR
jgi:hypothetical protein